MPLGCLNESLAAHQSPSYPIWSWRMVKTWAEPAFKNAGKLKVPWWSLVSESPTHELRYVESSQIEYANAVPPCISRANPVSEPEALKCARQRIFPVW